MNSVRDRANGMRAEYVKEWQQEHADEQRQREDADPVVQFQKTADASAQATKEAILTQKLPESFFPGERVAGRKVDEAAMLRNWKEWATSTPSFEKSMADVLLAFYERNDLAPIAENFTRAHNLLLEYGCYPEESAQADSMFSKFGTVQRGETTEAQAKQSMAVFLSGGWRRSDLNARLLLKTLQEAGLAPFLANLQIVDAYLKSENAYPEPSVLTPSEKAAAVSRARMNDVVVIDTDGKEYTEYALDQLRSEDARRLRRIMETGNAGNQHYQNYLAVKDRQAILQAITDTAAQREEA